MSDCPRLSFVKEHTDPLTAFLASVANVKTPKLKTNVQNGPYLLLHSLL